MQAHSKGRRWAAADKARASFYGGGNDVSGSEAVTVLPGGGCNSTPVGVEPTRGDPIGLAGRRLSRSAKVSSARATGLSHLSSQKGSDLGQETFFLDQWSLWVSVCGVVDLEVKLGVRCRATHRSGLIHVSLILDNVSIADARFAGFPSGIIR